MSIGVINPRVVANYLDTRGVDEDVNGAGFRRRIQLDVATRFLECPPPIGKPGEMIDFKARMRMVGIDVVNSRSAKRRSTDKREDQCEMRFHQYSLSVKGKENLHVQ